jgi:predicted TPR repeat methyltransferase
MKMMSPALALLQRASELIENGALQSATPLLLAARSHGADASEVALLEAQRALRDRALLQGLEILDRAILADPVHSGLRKQRSSVRFQLGDHAGAIQDAAEVVALDPADADAKSMLGEVLLELGHLPQAIACLDDAVASAPKRALFRQRLANALSRANHDQQALRVLTDGIDLGPPNVSLFNAAITLCITRTDTEAALTLIRRARLAGVANAETFAALGRLLHAQHRYQEAGAAFVDALKLQADDDAVRYLAAVCGAIASPDRAPIAALRQSPAEYPEPGLLAAIARLAAQPLPTAGMVLDLGCDASAITQTLPAMALTGVTVNPSQLAAARAANRYADLQDDDIQSYLDTSRRTWPLIIAASALRHFGDLDPPMASIRNRLDPTACLLCFLETIPSGTWRLQVTGHYAHALDYIYTCVCANQLRVLARNHIGNGVLLTIGRAPQ